MKRKIIFWISLAVLVLCVAALTVYWFVFPHAQPQKETVEPIQPPVVEAPVLPDNPVDFTALQQRNADICGWIKVPGTSVDYAVVCGVDYENDFYLNHNLDKAYEFAGSIYMQPLNHNDFTDPNTVLYGHNMRNGSMFATLLKFRDATFFNENRYIYMYTPGHILTYEIFSAYRYDNRHLLYAFDFNDPAVFASYLEMARDPASSLKQTAPDVQVGLGDRILTLSTCITSDDYRYLVQGVLIDDQHTK